MQQPKVKAALTVSAILSGLVIQGCHKPAPDTAAQAAIPIPVNIMTAQVSSMNKSLPVVGQLQSDNQVNLTSKVAGKVNKLLVTTGDRVNVGELLVVLDNSDAISQLQQAQANLAATKAHYDQTRSGVGLKDTQTATAIASAKANLASAQARLEQTVTAAKIEDTQTDTGVQQAQDSLKAAQQNLGQIKEGSRTQERAQAQIAVERAQADLNHAQDNFNRISALFKEGAVSQQNRDDASYALQQSQASIDAAKQQLSLIQEGSRTQQVAIAEAQVRQAQSALENAKAQVQHRSMSRNDVQQAEEQVRQLQAQLALAKAGTAQYVMTRQDVEVAAAQVGQASAQVDLAKLALSNTRIFSPVAGVIDTRPTTIGSSVSPTTILMTIVPTRGVYFEANVPELAISSVHVGDAVTTTVDALPNRTFPGRISEIIPVADVSTKLYRVHISVPDANGILPQNGFARALIVTSQAQGIIVPKEALATMVGDTYLYVVDNGHAHRQFVTIGVSDDTSAQILTGLKPGDQFVSFGKETVSDGSAVSAKPDARQGA